MLDWALVGRDSVEPIAGKKHTWLDGVSPHQGGISSGAWLHVGSFFMSGGKTL